jgi:hypothetical protein
VNPLQVEILLWYFSRARDYRDGDFSAPAVRAQIDNFREVGILAAGEMTAYILTATRLCTDGEKNACSFLYGAAARACFALGYSRIGTYILKSEDGTSLTAAGWRLIGETPGRSWSVPSRHRTDKHPLQPKLLFETAA